MSVPALHIEGEGKQQLETQSTQQQQSHPHPHSHSHSHPHTPTDLEQEEEGNSSNNKQLGWLQRRTGRATSGCSTNNNNEAHPSSSYPSTSQSSLPPSLSSPSCPVLFSPWMLCVFLSLFVCLVFWGVLHILSHYQPSSSQETLNLASQSFSVITGSLHSSLPQTDNNYNYYLQLLSLAQKHMDEQQFTDFLSATDALFKQQTPVATGESAELVPDTPSSSSSCPVCPSPSPSSSVVLTDFTQNLTISLQGSAYQNTGNETQTPWKYCEQKVRQQTTGTQHTSFERDNTAILINAMCTSSIQSVTVPWLGAYPVCDPSDFRMEQWFLKQQFQVPTENGYILRPVAPRCLHLPPVDYVFPGKYQPLPALNNSHYIHWQNHYVQNQQNLSSFNEGYTKNLYHFDAPFYDMQQLKTIYKVAVFIPFQSTIRNALDIGAGGGSIALLLHRMYNIITLSLVYAELPYCEYITERGGLCAHINAFLSMPFAKFSYDLIHAAWLFHMHSGVDLVEKLMELDRVLRPGGYLWWEGGFSHEQSNTVKQWAASIGYNILYEESVEKYDKTKWKNQTHECDVTIVFRKPSVGIPTECK